MPQIFISPDVPGIVLGTGNIPMSKKDNNPTPSLASDKLCHSQIGQEQVGSEKGLQAPQLGRWTKAHCAQVTVTL